MKKKLMPKSDLTQKFSEEMIEGKKMNYLVGGDGHGSQGAIDDPWL
jgi:hypothetical protein